MATVSSPTAGIVVLLIITILVALSFDFTNGFHDTANAIATAIGTRAISPLVAVILSGCLNLIGALFAIEVLHTTVANTVGGLVKPTSGTVMLTTIIAALISAIGWNLLTWRAGIPSSSSHALIGSLVGMALAAYGTSAVVWSKLVPVILGLLISPIAGFVLAYVFSLIVLHAFRRARPGPANRVLQPLQVLSGAFVSFSHGANDAQKTMAVITLALVSSGEIHSTTFPTPPLWVVILSAVAIGTGTFAGGWRIIRTLGTRVARLQPVDGFAAQTVAAVVIQTATQMALPVSTTHVVSGSVMGAGSTRRLAAVRWATARNMVIAWVVTIPSTIIIGGILGYLAAHL